MTSLINDTAAIAFLKELSAEERQELLSLGTTLPLAIDDTVIRQGQEQPALYLVLEGSLRVRCHSPYSVVEIGLLGAGDCFGEMNLLDPLKASATITGIEAGTLWKLERDAFQQFVENHPRAGVKLLTYFGIQLTKRMRRMEDQLLRCSERPTGFDYDY